MIIYNSTKTEFMKDVDNDNIANIIEKKIFDKMHRHTPKSEFRSWENSLEYMYKVFNDNEIPGDAGVAIEYNIPQTSKRVDFLVSGYDKNDMSNVIIVELKQWDSLEAIDGMDAQVRTYTGGALRQVVHPSYQAWSYASMIKDYNETVQKTNVKLHPCAYLHNYIRTEKDPIDKAQYKIYLDEAPAFTRGQVLELRDYIKQGIIKGDNAKILYEIDNGKIKPSKSLQDTISSMLKGNKEFVMLDDQKVVYEEILKTAKRSKLDNKKRVIIIKGGPGTGKTVVAVNLLAQLTCEEQFVQYVSKNSAPREVYKKKLKADMKLSSIDNLFKGSGTYTETQSSIVDTILVDEAHRLNEKSGMFQNMGENQIKEIINAAKCSVFFIDESQRVTTKDIGSIAEIKKWAHLYSAEIQEYELISQFRCNGSDGYLSWLDNVLEIHETANYNMDDIDYDIQILDTPQEVYDKILDKNHLANKARILAGYCWNWIKDGKDKSDVHDIKIGDFEISWNLGNTNTFAIDNDSVGQAGCIHTSQGLEFDYVGVIIGDDMRYEDGHIITDFFKRASTDQSIKGLKGLYKINQEKALSTADEIIKNTYRTLMTRGMKGCYVYCTNKALSQHLKESL